MAVKNGKIDLENEQRYLSNLASQGGGVAKWAQAQAKQYGITLSPTKQGSGGSLSTYQAAVTLAQSSSSDVVINSSGGAQTITGGGGGGGGAVTAGSVIASGVSTGVPNMVAAGTSNFGFTAVVVLGLVFLLSSVQTAFKRSR